MTDRPALLRAAEAALPAGPQRLASTLDPVWHAISAMALASHDPTLAASHLGFAAGPWERFGALRATVALSLHHATGEATTPLLSAEYPLLVERRRSLRLDARGLPSPDAAACSAVVRADRDLAEIALVLGHNPEPFEAWAEALRGAVDTHLWDESAATYRSGGAPRPLHGAATLFGAIPDRSRAERVADALDGFLDGGADTDLGTPGGFVVSLLALDGLRSYGLAAPAARLEDRLAPTLAEALNADDPGLRYAAAVTVNLAFGR